MVATPVLWKDLETINPPDPGNQYAATTVALGNGRHVVAWLDTDGGPTAAIRGQIFDARGEPLGDAFELSLSGGDAVRSTPALAARADGGFVAVYGAGSAVRIDTFDRHGDPVIGRPTTVADEPGIFFDATLGVAMGPDGRALVTYQKVAADGSLDVMGRFVEADGGIGAAFAVYDLSGDEDRAYASHAVVLSDGRFLVAHESMNAANECEAAFTIVTPGAPPAVDPAKPISPAGENLQFDSLEVTAMQGGGFVAVYADRISNTDFDIRAAIFDNDGNVIKAPFTVNANTNGAQFSPEVAALDDGGFVVAWNDVDAHAVRAQRYDAAGETIGEAFIAGEIDPGAPLVAAEISIAALDDGRFVVARDRIGADGERDVDGRIFDPRGKNVDGTDDHDVLTGFATGGKVKGKGGDDVLFGVDAADKLIGNDGGDLLFGNGGDDKLYGNDGKDWLAGGDGNDWLKGGAGPDNFVFDTGLNAESNVDTLKDFRPGEDKIYLDEDVFDAIGDRLSSSEITIGKKAADDNDHIIVKEGRKANKIYYDPDGKGGEEQVLFAKVDDDVALSRKDFVMFDDLLL